MSQTDDFIEFADDLSAPEPISILTPDVASPPPWIVLVVDDEPDVIAITKAALRGSSYQGRPIALWSAGSAAEARRLLKESPDIAVILLDVVMETDDAGLQLVRHIREELRRHAVRIILRTGQPGLAPERDVVLRYDINDYRLKTEMTARSLYTTVIAALRGYAEMTARFHAEMQAMLAQRAKSEFLANINHELRTPLNAIMGYAEMMVGEAFGALGCDAYRDFASEIMRCGRELTESFQAILDMANLENDGLELHIEDVSPGAVLEHVHQMMGPQARKAGLEFVCVPPDPTIEARADRRRLGQILCNLTSNAIKFTPAGGQVTLSARRDDRFVAFSVIDTGIGMTAEEIRTALMMFAQVDGSVSRLREGSGLGLPLAQRLTERHGGALFIESAPGQGATVEARIPLKTS